MSGIVLKLDRGVWATRQCEDSYVIDSSTGDVVAKGLTLDVAVQIVDEHEMVSRMIETLEARSSAGIYVYNGADETAWWF